MRFLSLLAGIALANGMVEEAIGRANLQGVTVALESKRY